MDTYEPLLKVPRSESRKNYGVFRIIIFAKFQRDITLVALIFNVKVEKISSDKKWEKS